MKVAQRGGGLDHHTLTGYSLSLSDDLIETEALQGSSCRRGSGPPVRHCHLKRVYHFYPNLGEALSELPHGGPARLIGTTSLGSHGECDDLLHLLCEMTKPLHIVARGRIRRRGQCGGSLQPIGEFSRPNIHHVAHSLQPTMDMVWPALATQLLSQPFGDTGRGICETPIVGTLNPPLARLNHSPSDG